MHVLYVREPVSAWSHGAWLLLILPGAWILWQRARGDRSRQWLLLGYAACLATCATFSTLYHGVQLPDEHLGGYLLLDHIGIYLLIAGSYTPIAWTLMRGRWRRGTLVAAWSAAAVGIGLNLVFGDLPFGLGTALYLAMGWGSIFCYLELGRTFSQRTLWPIMLGGILYSVGAAFHVLHWPVLWPGVVRGHEIFHILVVAASGAHYWFMLTVVAPAAGMVSSGRPLNPPIAQARVFAQRSVSRALARSSQDLGSR